MASLHRCCFLGKSYEMIRFMAKMTKVLCSLLSPLNVHLKSIVALPDLSNGRSASLKMPKLLLFPTSTLTFGVSHAMLDTLILHFM